MNKLLYEVKLQSTFIWAGLGFVSFLFLLAMIALPVDLDKRQVGYRGTGMIVSVNATEKEADRENHVAPEVLYELFPEDDEGDKAGDIYENVQVLGHLSDARFNRLMAAITEWVAPEQGCAYCHGEDGDFASEAYYPKIVARKMIQMTMNVNENWSDHVGQVGVTCFTCHRGNNVPEESWFVEPVPLSDKPIGVGWSGGSQNSPGDNVALATLPNDHFRAFLLEDNQISAQNLDDSLPIKNAQYGTIKSAEWTYGLMIHMSEGLGVNCVFCHNSRAFGAWDESPPQRVTAWHGIRMARELNVDYMESLTAVFPEHRLGPTGDVAKANCATCHNGINKPLYGAPMAKDYPSLLKAGALGSWE